MEGPAGILLVGGQGRRMGGGKPGQLFRGRTLLDIARTTLESVAQPVLVLEDEEPGQGPLGGLWTGLRASPCHWNQVMPVDMPFMTSSVLVELYQLRAGLAVVPRCAQGRLHPLCGIYHRDCLPSLGEYLRAGHRRVLVWLDSLDHRIVELGASPDCFLNLNSRAELDAAAGGPSRH